ncbi:MAG: hypothetical protein A2V88_10205 [Elusimicrobia bacterium RBG_16_66_12]|nr:MAG: hypothetical protein A2V88_10205 [Elusimicrobia bacterium RBG_16_66_12]
MLPRTLPAALAAALLAWGAPARAADRAGARRQFDQARALYLQGEFKESLRTVNDALGADARLGPAYELRARLWHVFGDTTRQKQDAQRALSLLGRNSLDAEELEAQGGAQLLLKQIDEAQATLDSAVQTSKRSASALAARARVWRELGENENAVAELDDAIKAGPQTALWFYARARAHYEMSNDAKAVADLTKALRLNKSFPIAYGLLGAALARQGDFPRGQKAYDRALALDPEYSFAHLGKAAIHLRLGAEAAALQEFEQAIRSDPQDCAPYFNRGEMHWRAGRQEQALSDFRGALDSPKLVGRVAQKIGDRYMSLQLWTDAIDAYAKARDLGRREALLRSAQAWEALKEPRKALANLDEAVQLDPRSAQFLAARGSLEARMGKDKNALDDLTRAVRLAPEDADILVARAGYLASREQPQLALEDYDRAIASDPGCAAAYSGRGALRANAFNEIDKALLDVIKAVELEPDSAVSHFNLGALRMKAGLYLQAIESFDTALALKGPAARILERRAEARSLIGDHVGARRDIELALEKDSESASAYSTLGAIRLHAREYEQSVRDFSQALRFDDGIPAAYARRGRAYGALGLLKAALSDLRRAAELDPRSKETWTDLCQTRRLMKDPKGALRDCDQAIALDSQHGPAYFQRALARLALKQHARVVEDIDTAWQLGARRAEGLLAKAVSHAASRQYKEAHRAYLQAVALDPYVRSPHVGFASGHPEGDDFLSAIVDLDASMRADQRDPYVFVLRADSLHNAEQFDKAVLEYTKAMELDGTLADAYTGRGAALNAQDALEAAQQDFMRAIELAPDDASARIRLAVTLTMRRNYKAALGELGKALKIEPRSAEAHLRAGNVHYFLKDYAKALENYTRAVKDDPLDSNALNGLGLGCFALKRSDDALESFSRAIALNPWSDRYYRNRASVWTSLQKYGNAAGDFRTASMVNTDASLVEEYRRLIEEAESRSARGKSS